MEIIEKSWNEFWAYYWRITSRHKIPGIFEWDKKVVTLIEAKCNLTPPKRILDLGCGGGDQAKAFAERGYSVIGIDIAEPLIEYARNNFNALGLSATFITNDMRNIDYRNEFDVCTLLSGTFGFFTNDGNLDLLRKINAALVPDGHVFIMYLSAHRTDLTKETWTETEGTYRLTKSWFDTKTSTYRSTIRLIMENGEVIIPKKEQGYHANEIIRCYTPPEMERLLTEAAFTKTIHLSGKHIEDPSVTIEPGDIIEIAVARKA